MALLNVMEEVVETRLNELMKNSDCCTCDLCREDIKCLALNTLPPKYVSTLKGKLFSKLSTATINQHMIDVNIACINAIEFVKERPRHDREESERQ
ncbi:MAG: late competence development ComFB family protein [Bacteroides sp.]|nr:late competence development ComFB family protein [Eubacterium sp.]MCM1417752.1 late competence development ComFB family protein [Roseburia sp.]MCM1461357.1 late competence development ComFB family protein [Bacteroides sp.]